MSSQVKSGKASATFECRKHAEKFKIEKTDAANIIKEEKIINQRELFIEKSKKQNRSGKYRKIYDILFYKLH